MEATAVRFKVGDTWGEPTVIHNVAVLLSNTKLTINSYQPQLYVFTSTASEETIGNDFILGSYAVDYDETPVYIRIMQRQSGNWQIYIDFDKYTCCYDVKLIN